MIQLLFLLGIMGLIAFGYRWIQHALEECPREVLGYKCRHDKCDHSPEALSQAKQTRLKRYDEFFNSDEVLNDEFLDTNDE